MRCSVICYVMFDEVCAFMRGLIRVAKCFAIRGVRCGVVPCVVIYVMRGMVSPFMCGVMCFEVVDFLP